MSGLEAKAGDVAHVRAIGLMSGTSMDGIDVAWVETDGRGRIERGPAREYPYSRAQVVRLEEAVEAGGNAKNAADLRERFADLERDLTGWHAEAVERFEGETGLRAELIGFHGQTIAHRPEAGWTVQLGDGERLAKGLGRAVAFDFRAADIEAGGEGAPLVPVYHEGLASGLFASEDVEMIAFLNIGGVANITILRAGVPPEAFDCGPGNMLIDRWLQREAAVAYDAGGRIASEGRVERRYLDEVLTRSFFDRTGPRSLDRLDFELPDASRFDISDGARTLTRLTAEAAAQGLAPFEPDLTIVCGGGRLNDLLIADLRDVLTGRVEVSETFGFDGGAMEAEAFAYLAVRCANGDPLTFPTTTGCKAPLTGGQLVQP